jgi:hypothetical protein
LESPSVAQDSRFWRERRFPTGKTCFLYVEFTYEEGVFVSLDDELVMSE